MNNPIKIGIVGLGRAGYGMHCDEIKNKRDKYQIVASCDIITERNRMMEEKYGCKTYEHIEELINDPNVELVDIATRSCDHFDHAILALKAGKDVLLEKPICETYEQALILKKLSSQPNGPRIYARHNRRFEYNFNKIKEIIDSGILGEVYEIHITRNSYNRRDDWQTLRQFAGGQLLNWGPHIVDQSLRLLQSPVKHLYSDIKHVVAAGDCEDHLTITYIGENNRTITMQISGGMALPTPEYRVYGTKGALEIEHDKIRMRYIDPEQKLQTPIADPSTPGQTFGKTGTFASGETIHWIEKVLDEKKEDLSIIWDYMYDAIRKGKEYPITMDEAIAVIEIISKVKENNQLCRF